jgi:hypothetical protein
MYRFLGFLLLFSWSFTEEICTIDDDVGNETSCWNVSYHTFESHVGHWNTDAYVIENAKFSILTPWAFVQMARNKEKFRDSFDVIIQNIDLLHWVKNKVDELKGKTFHEISNDICSVVEEWRLNAYVRLDRNILQDFDRLNKELHCGYTFTIPPYKYARRDDLLKKYFYGKPSTSSTKTMEVINMISRSSHTSLWQKLMMDTFENCYGFYGLTNPVYWYELSSFVRSLDNEITLCTEYIQVTGTKINFPEDEAKCNGVKSYERVALKGKKVISLQQIESLLDRIEEFIKDHKTITQLRWSPGSIGHQIFLQLQPLNYRTQMAVWTLFKLRIAYLRRNYKNMAYFESSKIKTSVKLNECIICAPSVLETFIGMMILADNYDLLPRLRTLDLKDLIYEFLRRINSPNTVPKMKKLYERFDSNMPITYLSTTLRTFNRNHYFAAYTLTQDSTFIYKLCKLILMIP